MSSFRKEISFHGWPHQNATLTKSATNCGIVTPVTCLACWHWKKLWKSGSVHPARQSLSNRQQLFHFFNISQFFKWHLLLAKIKSAWVQLSNESCQTSRARMARPVQQTRNDTWNMISFFFAWYPKQTFSKETLCTPSLRTPYKPATVFAPVCVWKQILSDKWSLCGR